MLVIADAERAVGLAGVMGGADSEVTDSTTDILIEAAHFDRKQVRRTARGLGMHTDASHRFERGTDPELCLEAASRAAALIAEIAGGTVLSGAIDARRGSFPPVLQGRLDLGRLDAFAGAAVPKEDALRWLTGLGFQVKNGGPIWDVTVPSWRLFDFQPRPDGSVWSQLGVFREGVIRARVLGRHGLTPYARRPWLVPLLATIVSVVAVALYFARKEKTS